MALYSWETKYNKERAPWGLITGFSLVTAAMAVFFIFSGNFLGALLFTIMPIALILSVSYAPSHFSGMITDTGVVMNSKGYNFQDIKSFSLVPGYLILKIRGKKIVYIPAGFDDEEGLRNALKDKLTEKQYQENIFDILYRILGIH
ncbi:MAG: hypothetical protein WD712_01465 [Candidatus Spechtbacterales bacterium]